MINNFYKDQIDYNDLLFIIERKGNPFAWEPAPYSTDENGEIKLNPQISRFYFKDGTQADLIHVKPVYYMTVYGHWRPLSEVCSVHGNKNITLKEGWDKMMHLSFLRWLIKRCNHLKGTVTIPTFSEFVPLSLSSENKHAHIMFTTSTFYPDPHVPTTTMDGNLIYLHTGDTWNTIHNASGATNVTATENNADPDTICQCNDNDAAGGDSRNQVSRTVFLFDSSAIGSGSTISSATMSNYIVAASDTSSTHAIKLTVAVTAPATNVALLGTDWANFTYTAQNSTDVTVVGITTGAYTDFGFNATGISNVSKTGVSKFGVMIDKDMANTAGGPSFDGSHQDLVTASFAEHTGTTQDPKLVVVYTTGGSTPTYATRMTLTGVGT